MRKSSLIGPVGRVTLPVVAAALVCASPAQALSRHGWDRASTIGEGALAAAALGLPAIQGDWGGLGQAGASLLVGGGGAYGLKQLIPERRPDGRGNDSFPSAHSAVSFAAAATLERRYGWQAGVPAVLVASFVGVARVQAHRHYWYDVVAGAALGSASGYLLTSPRDGSVRMTPWAGHDGGGLALAVRF